MKAVKVIMGFVLLCVVFIGGMSYNEYLVRSHCLNDTGYTNIGGIEFACVDKASFSIQFMPRSQHEHST